MAFYFRNVFDEGSDEYKIIMLNKRFLTFRIVKVCRLLVEIAQSQ